MNAALPDVAFAGVSTDCIMALGRSSYQRAAQGRLPSILRDIPSYAMVLLGNK